MALPRCTLADVEDGAGQNIDDLLEGLEGAARAERAELVEWLLEQGITADEIRATNPPLLLATPPPHRRRRHLRVHPGDQREPTALT